MPNPNSQEMTIYRSLSGQIQMGFYDGGARFPSVQEVSRHYQVSYCPAQRALKALERDGLIRLCRGKETQVLAKPYGDYLGSPVFLRRSAAMADLVRSLKLISTAIGLQGMRRLEPEAFAKQEESSPGKRLYRMFDKDLRALGSQLVLSLYYDVGAFLESGLLDILRVQEGAVGAERLLAETVRCVQQTLADVQSGGPHAAGRSMEWVDTFFQPVLAYLEGQPVQEEQESFHWEPRKGRTRYCDVVAVDLVCKINQGTYPVGTLLPGGDLLADIYHVSSITMRRTIALLNQLGVAETINGVGTRVIFRGDATIPYKMKELTLDDNLRTFLEALQLLAFTCEPVLRATLPHLTPEARASIIQAASREGQKASMVAAFSACLQAVVRCCPLAAIREIYGKITLQLLWGSVLRLEETGEEPVTGWPQRARALQTSLAAGDDAGFAAVFRAIAEDNFLETKRYLQKVGTGGVDAVADPVPLDH